MAQLLAEQSEVSGNLQTIAENGFSNQIAENEADQTVLGGMFGKRDLLAIGEGEIAFGAKAGMAINTATRFFDKLGVFGESSTSSDFDKIDRFYLDALKESRPDPTSTGYVAQIASGLIGIVPFYLGGIQTAMAVEGNASFLQAKDAGLNNEDAFGKASMDAMWAGIYGKVPAAFAGGRAASVVKASVASVGVGIASRYSTGEYLESINQPEMAAQYKTFDEQAMFTDLVFGAAFGYAYGKNVPLEPNATEPPPSMVSAAAVANQVKHQEINAAQGIPENTAARQAHNQAFELAMQQLQTDRPVDVAAIMKNQTFIDHPYDQSIADIIAKTLDENGFNESIAMLREAELKAETYGVERTPDSYDSMASFNAAGKAGGQAKVIHGIPSMIPNAEGQPITAHQAIQHSDNDIQSANELAKGIEVAADCSMRFGQ